MAEGGETFKSRRDHHFDQFVSEKRNQQERCTLDTMPECGSLWYRIISSTSRRYQCELITFT